MKREAPIRCQGFRGRPDAYAHFGAVQRADDLDGRWLCDRCWARETLRRYGRDDEGRVRRA